MLVLDTIVQEPLLLILMHCCLKGTFELLTAPLL